MNKYIVPLSRCPLFENILIEELDKLIDCFSPLYRKVEKNGFVFMENQEANFVGVVLSGRINFIQHDYWGNRLILDKAGAGHIFGETFSMGNSPKLPVSAVAVEKSELLIFSSRRILHPCASMCGFHFVLIQNVIRDLARKNMVLMRKIEHISRRTTREKLLSYLSSQSQNEKPGAFDIPFNRQELADYLSVDRSAMCTELGRMRDDGLIKFCKNRFELC